MKVATRALGFASAACLLVVQHTAAWAQSSQGIAVDYVPVTATVTSVPTLSEWGMIVLSVLLAAVALYILRGNKGGKPLAALILASSLALGGLGGHGLLSEAHALGVTSSDCPTDGQLCYVTVASGGTVTVKTINLDVAITNNTGIAQRITGIRVLSETDQIRTPTLTPQCTASLVLQAGARCYVNNNSSA